MLPLAHSGHWLVNVLYLAPLIAVLGTLGYQSVRDRRRGTGPRREPTDDEPRPAETDGEPRAD